MRVAHTVEITLMVPGEEGGRVSPAVRELLTLLAARNDDIESGGELVVSTTHGAALMTVTQAQMPI